MSESKSSDAGSEPERSENQIAAGAPDPAKCRAVLIDLGRPAAWCKTKQTEPCRFALPFGNSFLCGHPDAQLIALRTLSETDPPDA